MSGVALIVDNGSLSIGALTRAVIAGGWVPRVVRHTRLGPLDADVAAVILSGTDVPASSPVYADELELIRGCRVPLIGICGGMHLIGRVYGEGIVDCTPTVGRWTVALDLAEPLFAGLTNPTVLFERHRFRLGEVPAGFARIAWSAGCAVEAIRHLERPQFGIQAHPEFRAAGRRILANFLDLASGSGRSASGDRP